MWFKNPGDGKHYNSDNVVLVQTEAGDGSEFNVVFLVINGSNDYVQYNSSPYADQPTAEAAITSLLGSFVSE